MLEKETFVKGDLVRCICARNYATLKQGAIYQVVEYTPSEPWGEFFIAPAYVVVKDLETERLTHCHASRFTLKERIKNQ